LRSGSIEVMLRVDNDNYSHPLFFVSADSKGVQNAPKLCKAKFCRFPLFLLFYKVVNYNVGLICVDGQDLPSVADDHKIQVRIGGR